MKRKRAPQILSMILLFLILKKSTLGKSLLKLKAKHNSKLKIVFSTMIESCLPFPKMV